MYGIFNPCDPAASLDLAYPILEQSLPLPRPDDSQPIRFRYRLVARHPLLDPALPGIQVIRRSRNYRCSGERQRSNLVSNQPDQDFRQRSWRLSSKPIANHYHLTGAASTWLEEEALKSRCGALA